MCVCAGVTSESAMLVVHQHKKKTERASQEKNVQQ
jgi:hypothetical protein